MIKYPGLYSAINMAVRFRYNAQNPVIIDKQIRIVHEDNCFIISSDTFTIEVYDTDDMSVNNLLII